MDLAARSLLAEAVLADAELAGRVADGCLGVRPGGRAASARETRQTVLAQVRQHQDFLAGALQAGSPTLFADYVRWCAARATDTSGISLQLELLEDQLPGTAEQRDLVERTIAAGMESLAEGQAQSPLQPEEERDPLRIGYLAAALGGDRVRAWEVVERARGELPLREVYWEILLWAQRRLGSLWQQGEISVAQEHMASAVTQGMLARMFATIPGDRDKGRAMVAGVEVELHALPAQFVADLLELDGWDVAFVGTHCPRDGLLSAIDSQRPDVLGLSTTLTSHLPQTVALTREVRRHFSDLPVVLGGSAVARAPELLEELRLGPSYDDPCVAFRPYARTTRDGVVG